MHGKEKTLVAETLRIKEIYEKDVNNIGDVYETIVEQEKITLATVTNDNIGDYIDLGNDPLEIGDTSKNWRIFYREGNTVYAILAYYLPNSTGNAELAGLNTSDTYIAYSTISRTALLTSLRHKTAWNSLANEIIGATVSGAATITQFKKSWEAKYPDNELKLDGNEEDGFSNVSPSNLEKNDNLYVIQQSEDGCSAYWLNSHYTNTDYGIWRVESDGNIYFDNRKGYGIRPVVSIPINTQVTHNDNLWIIQK